MRTKQKERAELYKELAAAAARDEDQRALLKTVLEEARKSEPAVRPLLQPPPQGALGDEFAPTAAAEAEADDRVTLAALSEEKTRLKVSELRLKRRAAALELSELREREATKEATVAREALEEALVRLEEKPASSRQAQPQLSSPAPNPRPQLPPRP